MTLVSICAFVAADHGSRPWRIDLGDRPRGALGATRIPGSRREPLLEERELLDVRWSVGVRR